MRLDNGPVPVPLTAENLRRAPKVLLHDHLDGGLRPQTILELADEAGVAPPSRHAAARGAWRPDSAATLAPPPPLETFALTTGVMNTAPSLPRVAREFVQD